MKIRSHCKINLFLHILGKREDNYHELESLFYFPEIYDEIEITETPDVSGAIEVDGKFAEQLIGDTKNNMILKSYSLLKIFYSTKLPDLSFKLTKNIPVSSGVGGGSANAAAVLKALNETYKLGLNPSQLYRIGARLGADVPACILDKTCLAKGVGEILSEVGEFPELNILLVNPMVPVSTAEIFRMGFGVYTGPISKDMNFKTTQNLIDFLENTRNDLEPNAKRICPKINDVLKLIAAEKGCLLSRMSGSGATCFGIFESRDAAMQAQENILFANPSYWVQAG